jgi:hypothetical protein
LVIIGAGGGVVWFLNSIFEGWLERRKQTARDFQTIAAYTVRNNELLEELNKRLQELEEKARDLH